MDNIYNYGFEETELKLLEAAAEKNWGAFENIIKALDSGASRELAFALKIAAEEGNDHITSLIINNAGDKVNLILNSLTGFSKTNALMFAAEKGHLKIVNLLLSAAGNRASDLVCALSYNNTSALMLASQNDYTKIVSILIGAAGENAHNYIRTSDNAGFTALMHACRNRHLDTAIVLMEALNSEEELCELIKTDPFIKSIAIKYLNKKCDQLDDTLVEILKTGAISPIVASYLLLGGDEESKRRYFPSSVNTATQQLRRKREGVAEEATSEKSSKILRAG